MIYSDIENMTNAEAVAYYGPLTVSHIPCRDLENLLDWAGIAKRNAITGAWEGSLIDFMVSNAVPALSEGLGELFSHLNKPHSTGIDTHVQPWASKMADLLGGLQMVGAVNAQLVADVVALAGGYAHADMSVELVQGIRDEYAADEARRVAEEADMAAGNAITLRYNELYNQHIAVLLDSKDYSDAAWVAALNAMASNWSN